MNLDKHVDIFIVDDNVVFSLALKSVIESAFKHKSLTIHLYATGETCIAGFKVCSPQLVILDFYLNTKFSEAADGFQILNKIKKASPRTSVIMLTSNNQVDSALKSFHNGVSDYVIKTNNPFNKIVLSISAFFTARALEYQHKENEILGTRNRMKKEERRFKTEEKERRSLEQMSYKQDRELQEKEREDRAAELVSANIQTAEAERSKQIVEIRNKDITDSINYAKRIQEAKLPSEEKIYAVLPQSFILFKPKDIVSGDFYFFHARDRLVFMVAADCTGHGVPGAFMSMIGSEKLAIAVSQSADTSEILNFLNRSIKKTLQQSDSTASSKDGMDIAICLIDTVGRTVKYAGANRPFWLVRNGTKEIVEIKGTKMAIGGLTDDEQHFDGHEIQLGEGDAFYIFTDGYADQFGGKHGKKLMTKKFKEILVEIQHKSMKEQKTHLGNFIERWRGNIEQVDDILIIGVRL